MLCSKRITIPPITDSIQSWNVYNQANIARVKADEAAAAAREAADEQRMQEFDAERRAAILRGQTPPPLPIEEPTSRDRQDRKKDGHDRKRRRLAGEDDTDRDIRVARTISGPRDEDDAAVLKLRQPKSDAPLTDHAGNINLFPVDMKQAIKRERNAEAEKEKKEKERAYEDQFTMRFTNAAGKGGALDNPWYTARSAASNNPLDDSKDDSGFESKNVWGREDPGRKDRQQARIVSSDPLSFMNQAQIQLKKSREDRKKWAEDKERELRDLRATEEREDKRDRHSRRRRHGHDSHKKDSRHVSGSRSARDKHRHRSRSRSPVRNRSRDREDERRSSRHERRETRHRSRERETFHRR